MPLARFHTGVFFEVTGLVGMRVEDKTVFDDTHRLILELVRTGAVDGLRIDHIDGLADPKAYLERLRQEVGPACYITVEKILAKGEQLPDDWPVSGTTGYEFIASLAEVLVDDEQIDNLRQSYETVKGAPVDMRAELRAAKLLDGRSQFRGENLPGCSLLRCRLPESYISHRRIASFGRRCANY
ncbi:glycosyl hydrolase [Salmonella enterica subsp. arizonae]|uniref:Glycosyl hydrolase n=1 Tax=Salmonella enterica subsp. arizonae TaxID=59203 RepID=A0A379TDT7_SALER|nr:glycosyl hydrolase [Salmonella enterica subsp. arizonae]